MRFRSTRMAKDTQNCCRIVPANMLCSLLMESAAFISGRATNGRCGALNGIQVLDNKLHGADGPNSPDDNGITGSGCGQNITNVKYSGNEVYYIGGHSPAPGGTSGNGI